MGKEGTKIQINNSSQVAGLYPSQTGAPNACGIQDSRQISHCHFYGP